MGFLSSLAPILGGVAGFVLSGGNPAGAALGASLGGAVSGASAAKDAASTQAQAGRDAIGAQQGMFNTTQGNIAPFVGVGQQYAGTLADLGRTDYATRQFGAADLKFGLAPNYDFIRQQGLLAANNASSVLGGVAGTGGNTSGSHARQ